MAFHQHHQDLFIVLFGLVRILPAPNENIEEGVDAVRDSLSLARHHEDLHANLKHLSRVCLPLLVLEIQDLTNDASHSVLDARAWHENLHVIDHQCRQSEFEI